MGYNGNSLEGDYSSQGNKHPNKIDVFALAITLTLVVFQGTGEQARYLISRLDEFDDPKGFLNHLRGTICWAERKL